ncbi:glycoside hydrolase [Penicillium daleae]|uniref:Glycoside hydrolase n=1 Tax=Penicillium daleae TaxID=63821 RepID=A0AAD6CDP2_9EURO|nr:glycoside hydrolase [Penicillium daleae]KAJ5461218.1 glycoside hydrolase [Penicillium daleae]
MINEYGALDQEAPAGILWQISQFERNEGTRAASGPWNIVVNNMEALGFASDRNAYLLLHYWAVDQGLITYLFTNSSLNITIPKADPSGAFAFEFSY